ncbi:Na+ ABC transporter ATP-binding protein [Aliidiomarina sedimenti]|uniref:Na+ ABC transporter ATP-binding protein n=1 Tax=Aliidiomarina sedimenti TaxID=1933879 RepID=A0ABY0C0J1_9GAMM|nr:ATP-binding cassette domain-containing protein [Aliidiomarina sedimenti]RUO30693.1 Na+ ABC transporter ATP-binding protein [Aliidiomarina sedimenti]
MHIEISNLVKEYATLRAVNQVSFSVNDGGIIALLGPNGAGKSSLVRMLVGLTEPDSGEIRVESEGKTYPHLPDGSFGYLPEDRGLYQDRTLKQNLIYIGQLRGLEKAEIERQLDHWLQRFELTERANEHLKQLSKGNQQKIQLIATLLHRPPMVILDEPFSGLDPVNQEHVLTVLKELKAEGVTILLSAHQMDLVERLADEFVLMNCGEVIAKGSLDAIHNQLADRQQIHFSFSRQVETDALQSLALDNLQSNAAGTHFEADVDLNAALDELLKQVAACGPLQEFRRHRKPLHDLYLSAVRSSTATQEIRS